MLISSRMLRTAVGVVMAAVLVVLVLPCAAMHRDVKAAATSLHHAVAARRHDHIGQAQAFLCTVVGEAVSAMATPAAVRLLWLAAAVIVVCVLSVICPPVTRGPPPHTEAATTVSGRTLIHRLCVLRR